MDAPPDCPLPTDADLTCDRLTQDIWVWQRRGGHRFSTDDLVTAWVAWQLLSAPLRTAVPPTPQRALDLGCGLGSVLLHLAWALPHHTFVGVEAQPASFALVERNIAHNQLGTRVKAVFGDLREPGVQAQLGAPFDLVTGTPPYFPPSTAVDAMDPQRAYARIEYRGGVEAYLDAVATCLAPMGRAVICGDARADARVKAHARSLGLCVDGRVEVIPREGAPPLFAVWTLRHAAAAVPPPTLPPTFTMRDAKGAKTPAADSLRAFAGL